MTEVSKEFLTAVDQIVDHVEVGGDATLCDSVDVIQRVLRAKTKRAAEVDEFLAERKEAGGRLDPATAEVQWTYAQTLDPYGIYPDLPEECQQVGREYFARSPGNDVWVSFYDLPEETATALWARMKAGEFDKDDDWPF
jgi:hypothetical protein